MHALQNSGNCTCLVVASSALLFRQLGCLLGCLLGGLLLLLARLLDGSLYALGGARSAALFLQLLLTALRLLFQALRLLAALVLVGAGAADARQARRAGQRGRGGSNIVAVAVAHLVITGAAVARLGLLAVVEVELARHGGRVERGIDGGRLILGAHVLLTEQRLLL